LNDIISDAKKVANNNELIVHCWRGGMRSSNFCQFVHREGISTHQLEGGYKTYRHAALELFKKSFHIIVIGGCTGSGKSEILRALGSRGEQILDLEKLANHKGSAFGGLMQPSQPTTEQFQNDMFEEMLHLNPGKRIWVEDESISIGKVFLPNDFWRNLCASPVVEIELEKSKRVERLVQEYGDANKAEFLQAMEKITTRLGGQHFNAAREKLLQDDMASTIEILLTYYDKAYLSGLEKKKSRIKEKFEWNGKDTDMLAREMVSKLI
jgi:tRNA 2-selenouridine synthase